MDPLTCTAPVATITGLSGRPMRVSSLRPGDVIELRVSEDRWPTTVMINSVKLQRIVMRDDIGQESKAYSSLHEGYYFVRHQTKRRWLAFLPKWIAKNISPYAQ